MIVCVLMSGAVVSLPSGTIQWNLVASEILPSTGHMLVTVRSLPSFADSTKHTPLHVLLKRRRRLVLILASSMNRFIAVNSDATQINKKISWTVKSIMFIVHGFVYRRIV